MFTTKSIANVGNFFDTIWNGDIKDLGNFLTDDAKFALVYCDDGENAVTPERSFQGKKEIVDFMEFGWARAVERYDTQIINISIKNNGPTTFIVDTELIQPHMIEGEFRKYRINSRQTLEMDGDLISSFLVERLSKCQASTV